MGVDVYLESESGEQLEELADPSGLVALLLPDWQDKTSAFLRFIDLYGGTVFNCLQMDTFVSELEAAVEKASEKKVIAHGRAILKLARKCKDEVHTYLKFYGD